MANFATFVSAHSITRMISAQIALHLVQVPLLIIIVIIICYTAPAMWILKIVLPVIFTLTLLLIVGYCYRRRLKKNKTKDFQESDNKEINYQSTKWPEKKSSRRNCLDQKKNIKCYSRCVSFLVRLFII